MTRWTKEEDDILQVGLERGLSHAMISLHLSGRSRNSCIGRDRRLGFSSGGKSEKIRTLKKDPPRKRVTKSKCRSVVAPLCTDGVVSQQPVVLVDHEDGQCRWPLRSPHKSQILYCGNECQDGHRNYCSGHAAIAQRPTRHKSEPVIPKHRKQRAQGSVALKRCV